MSKGALARHATRSHRHPVDRPGDSCFGGEDAGSGSGAPSRPAGRGRAGSLDFGYPFIGFGASPPTRFENISLVRAGGHFWGAQTFPAIWVFSASKEFRGIRVSDVDIVDPTYSGIMVQTKYNGAGQPENPVTDTVFTNVSISGARKSGHAFDAKSGFGIWVNEMPEPGQGPAVGSATFVNLRLSGNHQDIKNTTSTFTIDRS